MKNKRKNKRYKEDDEDIEMHEEVKHSSESRKKNPPRRKRNSQKRQVATIHADFQLDESIESDK
jgi:hypothetical protein